MINLTKINSSTAWKQLAFILSVILLSSCSSEGKKESLSTKRSPRIRKAVTLVSPTGNITAAIGDTVELQIAHKDGLAIDSAFLFSEKRRLIFDNNKIQYIHDGPLGRASLKLIAYVGSDQETLYPTITYLPTTPPIEYAYRIVRTFPHDEGAWTQGLFFDGDDFYESTGQIGESSLRKTTLATGEVLQITNLDRNYFGEGSAIINDKIYQLTWKNQVCFVYNKDLEVIGEHQYQSQGWGLATFNDQLVMSDGSEKLQFINPKDFTVVRTIQVYDTNGKVEELNELEVFNGQIYANIWGQDRIVIIDPDSGAVVGDISFQGILGTSRSGSYDKSMNGIAIDNDGRIFVTGKYWPELYEVVLIPKSNPQSS
jgi:glutamine cyclotransferase